MTPEVLEALEAACGVERRDVYLPHVRPDTTLGDWQTFDPPIRKSVTTLRRQVLAMLRELPEDMTVADLRSELEE